MKEATGELNMTVVTVVAIAALVAFFYLIIWPTIKTGMTLTSACNSAGTSGNFTSGKDGEGKGVCSDGSCTYTDENGNTSTRQCDASSSK